MCKIYSDLFLQKVFIRQALLTLVFSCVVGCSKQHLAIAPPAKQVQVLPSLSGNYLLSKVNGAGQPLPASGPLGLPLIAQLLGPQGTLAPGMPILWSCLPGACVFGQSGTNQFVGVTDGNGKSSPGAVTFQSTESGTPFVVAQMTGSVDTTFVIGNPTAAGMTTACNVSAKASVASIALVPLPSMVAGEFAAFFAQPLDSNGNCLTNIEIVFYLTSASDGIIRRQTQASNPQGVASVAFLLNATVDTYTLLFKTPDASPALQTTPVQFTSTLGLSAVADQTVMHPASALAVSLVAGAAPSFELAVTVSLGGAPVAGIPVTWSGTGVSTSTVLSSPSGLAQLNASALVLTHVGEYYVMARVPGMSSSVLFQITVTPGAAVASNSQLVATSSDGSTVTALAQFLDAYGNSVSQVASFMGASVSGTASTCDALGGTYAAGTLAAATGISMLTLSPSSLENYYFCAQLGTVLIGPLPVINTKEVTTGFPQTLVNLGSGLSQEIKAGQTAGFEAIAVQAQDGSLNPFVSSINWFFPHNLNIPQLNTDTALTSNSSAVLSGITLTTSGSFQLQALVNNFPNVAPLVFTLQQDAPVIDGSVSWFEMVAKDANTVGFLVSPLDTLGSLNTTLDVDILGAQLLNGVLGPAQTLCTAAAVPGNVCFYCESSASVFQGGQTGFSWQVQARVSQSASSGGALLWTSPTQTFHQESLPVAASSTATSLQKSFVTVSSWDNNNLTLAGSVVNGLGMGLSGKTVQFYIKKPSQTAIGPVSHATDQAQAFGQSIVSDATGVVSIASSGSTILGNCFKGLVWVYMSIVTDSVELTSGVWVSVPQVAACNSGGS